SNLFPCTDNNMRFLLQNFIDNGGKAIVEGGQTGYVSDVIPEYPAFKSKVMKIDSWQTDNGGAIIISNEYRNSILATVPNVLKDSIRIIYSGPADMDVCAKNEFSKLFYKTEKFNDKLGILVFPNVESPQIINLFFCYSRIDDKSSAKHLIINSAFNLIGKPIGIELANTVIPEKFFLHQNYPNPFNPVTVIRFEIKETDVVNLKIYDVLGNEISVLVNEKQSPGIYNIKFDGSFLSGGVYYYKLTTSKFSDTKKLVLIK
ncbi:MAG: T9SS type A sorting domain-containing protein, partial [Ignavibacteria bacterium]